MTTEQIRNEIKKANEATARELAKLEAKNKDKYPLYKKQ